METEGFPNRSEEYERRLFDSSPSVFGNYEELVTESFPQYLKHIKINCRQRAGSLCL